TNNWAFVTEKRQYAQYRFILRASTNRRLYQAMTSDPQLKAAFHWTDVYFHKFLQDPEGQLARLCRVLNISCSKQYLRDCARIVFPDEHQTYHLVKWLDSTTERFRAQLRSMPWFASFADLPFEA